MQLEWNPEKSVKNLQKHGVDFEDAALVFYDENRLECFDSRNIYGEDRWVTMGMAHLVLLYVVYTVRHDETIRLISARKANAHERKKYREANG